MKTKLTIMGLTLMFAPVAHAQSSGIVAGQPQGTNANPVVEFVDDILAVTGSATAGHRMIDRLVPEGAMVGHISADQTAKVNDVYVGRSGHMELNQIEISAGSTIGWIDVDQTVKVSGAYLGENASLEINTVQVDQSLIPHANIDQNARVQSISAARNAQIDINGIRIGR